MPENEDAKPTSEDQSSADGVQSPPSTLMGTLTRLGPGMIIAGSIVGSGELIATTTVGAKAGFALLWLILIGCLIKVFVQVEVGRFTVTHGKSSIEALNSLPGPGGSYKRDMGQGGKRGFGAHPFVWLFLIVTMAVITQQGGIIGGVGQALTVGFPLTERGEQYKEAQDRAIKIQVELGQQYKALGDENAGSDSSGKSRAEALRDAGIGLNDVIDARLAVAAKDIAEDKRKAAENRLQEVLSKRRSIVGDESADAFAATEARLVAETTALRAFDDDKPRDDAIWATILAVVTAILLYIGRYGLIQWVATIFVVMFTLMTVGTLIMLQLNPDWAVTGSEFAEGFKFSVPEKRPNQEAPLAVALAAFGIIGVGSVELIMYPYWCLEKGYAKWTGPNDGSSAWVERAKGWMRVMRIDAWLSMVVYTFATAAFYLLGAAVLGRSGLVPEGTAMVRTLSEMYVPVFGGEWAQWVFLVGAITVLYSTFFVAAAGNSRMLADTLGIVGLVKHDDATRKKWTQVFCVGWPLLAAGLYWVMQAPVAMVLISGVGQMLLLPILGTAALFFRYKRCEPGLRPTSLWDVFLWISVLGTFVVATWYLWQKMTG